MKIILIFLVYFFLFTNCQAQMLKNGKLVSIRKATKQMMMNAIAGEYNERSYRTNTSIKFDSQGNFKMVYVYEKKDEYSKLIKATIPGDYYKRIVSGKYKLYEANYERFNNIGNVQPTDKYGDPIKDNLYVRFFIHLMGNDDRGNAHSMCADISQREDSQYIYGWTINYTSRIGNSECNCFCETGDSKSREITIPYIKLRK